MSLLRPVVPAVLLLSLSFLTACEYWEDLWDDSKPPPNTPLAKPADNKKFYTKEEAVDHIAHKLIMRFSRYSLPPFIYLTSNNGIGMQVFEKLLAARAVTCGRGGTDNPPVRFEEELSGLSTVTFRAVDLSTKKVIYEESFCLK